MLNKQANRIWFLQVSRACACLLIVYVHWIGLVRTPNAIHQVIYQDALEGYMSPEWARLVASFVGNFVPSNFREVYFGLGLFFLTSGYVIPLSMDKISPAAFLIRRVMRIYPTAIVCTFIAYLMLTLGRAVDGSFSTPVAPVVAVKIALLVRDLFRTPYVDTVIWTLEIEVHFYMLCYVLALFHGHRRATAVLVVGALFVLAAYMAGSHSVDGGRALLGVTSGTVFHYIAFNGAFIVLMLVGMALFNYDSKYWSGAKTTWVIVAVMAMNYYCLRGNPITASEAGAYYSNHVYVVLAFALLMRLNARLPYSRFLDAVAEVSYPLYLLHGAAGYTVFYVAYKTTTSFTVALALSAAWIVGMSTVINRYVERPSIRKGRELTSQVVPAPEGSRSTSSPSSGALRS